MIFSIKRTMTVFVFTTGYLHVARFSKVKATSPVVGFSQKASRINYRVPFILGKQLTPESGRISTKETVRSSEGVVGIYE